VISSSLLVIASSEPVDGTGETDDIDVASDEEEGFCRMFENINGIEDALTSKGFGVLGVIAAFGTNVALWDAKN
jgi:hypothetical protein